jgi:ankyrin repeat protein
MWQAQQHNNLSKFDQFISWLDDNRQLWEDVRDSRGRTVLHAAVENGNLAFVKTLVSAGVDINAKELCAATPLTIAVVKENEEMAQFLN